MRSACPELGQAAFWLEKAAPELGLHVRWGWALQRRVEGMQLGYLGVACCRMGKRDKQGEVWKGWSLDSSLLGLCEYVLVRLTYLE